MGVRIEYSRCAMLHLDISHNYLTISMGYSQQENRAGTTYFAILDTTDRKPVPVRQRHCWFSCEHNVRPLSVHPYSGAGWV